MSNRTRSKRTRRCGVALAVGLASLAAPVASAVAEPVLLGSAADYSVLGGATVTNTGPSVLTGDLGVFSGSALPGFGPATINGSVHAADADAGQAQTDLTTAYTVAANQTTPLPPVDLLTQNLAGLTLTPGSYRFTNDALLAGSPPLTLDDLGDPNAQFVFIIPRDLIAAAGSSVVGVSGCNVYWQVADEATIGTNSSFLGNIMADQSIALQTGATLTGRALARIGQVSLDDNIVNAGPCGARTTADTTGGGTTPTGGGTIPTGGTPLPTGNTGNQPPPGSQTTRRPRRGTSTLRRTTPAPGATCTDGFTARVRGSYVKSVVFRLDGKRISTRRRSPFSAYVKAAGQGKHKVTAKVTYKDATRAKTMTLRYRGCAAAALQPRRGPSRFTG